MTEEKKPDIRLAKKVLLIGWGSADWKVINPLIEQGKLPNLKKLAEIGAKATIANIDPSTPPISWTSVMTGKGPAKHNVATFTDLSTDKINPISVNSRKVKAIWNILSDYNLKAHQVGCWTSHPAESINGVSVSDLYPYFTSNDLPTDAIYPKDKKDLFAGLLVTGEEVTKEQLTKFIPEEYWKDFGSDLAYVKSFVAQIASLQNAAKNIIEKEEWDFVSLVFSQLTNFKTQYLEYQLEGSFAIPQDAKMALENMVTAAYEMLDTFLGELMGMVEEDITIFLVSQAGFLPDPLFIDKLRKPNSSWEYNIPGIFVFKGKQAQSNEEIFGVSSLDITPTILLLLGLPFAKDFDGKGVIAQKYFNKKMKYVDTFEDADTVKETIDFTVPDTLLEKQFVNLTVETSNIEKIEEYNIYLKARKLITVNNHAEAAPILEELWEKYPKNCWYGGRLVGCYIALNKHVEAKALLDKVLELETIVPELHFVKGQILMAEMKFRSASKQFEIVESELGMISGLHGSIAEAYASMGQWKIAAQKFKKEIEVNPHPAVYMGLSMLYIQNKKFDLAIEPLETSIALAPAHPIALFHLGTAYLQTKQFPKCEEAMLKAQEATRDAGLKKEIAKTLMQLYQFHWKQPEKIKAMKEKAERFIGSLGTITIVSGLPRSGTSMMMQMLDRGGMDVFTDGLRVADDNNKKGYYEHEAVKGLAKNKQFLSQVGDKAVKIISHLLNHLPNGYKYKIVFMDRDIKEVMTSQHKMLGRLNKDRGNNIDNSMALLKTFAESRKKAIGWARKNKKNVEILVVSYTDIIKNPQKQAKVVNKFLGGHLDVKAMASVADKSLYREKADKITV